MDQFPAEILRRIFRFLPLNDQLKCEMVSVGWCQILRTFWAPRNGVSLDQHYKLSVLCDDRVDASTAYEKPVTVRLLECIFKRYGGQIKLIRVDKSTELSIQFLAAIPRYCPNLETIWFSSVGVMYHDSEINSLPSLAPLVSLRSLRTVVLNSNGAIQIDARNWSVGRPWAIGTVCPVVQLFPIGLDSMTSGLTKLWLEDVMISTRTFISLCHRLGPTLQYFCLKLDECSLQKCHVPEALACLTRLVHLNFGGPRVPSKTFASLLDHVALEIIGNTMNYLETLSLRGAFNLTSADVCFLLNSVCGRRTLRYLNLISCPKVNSNISSGVYQRSSSTPAPPLLTIFAYNTDIQMKWAQRMSGADCNVIINPKFIDETVFWGEQKSEAATNGKERCATNNIDDTPELLSDSSESD